MIRVTVAALWESIKHPGGGGTGSYRAQETQTRGANMRSPGNTNRMRLTAA